MNPAPPPLVCVVTPVYNGVKYIRECIDSVLAQTYPNWRYVLLDNASTDGTAAILAEFAARDPRIQVVRNPQTLPIADNHNAALRLMPAEAEYCKPLMADDWLMPECLERMVSAARADASIGLVCTWVFDGRHVLCDGWPYPAHKVDGREVARAHLLSDKLYVLGSPTSGLLRADLVRARPQFYNPLNEARDYESCLDVLQSCAFAFVHQVLSFQRMHEESVTSQHAALEGGYVGRLMALARWGPAFLSAQEFDERMKIAMRTYYQILATQALEGATPEFWKYHRQQFEKLGTTLNKWTLTKTIARRIVRNSVSPAVRNFIWKFT